MEVSKTKDQEDDIIKYDENGGLMYDVATFQKDPHGSRDICWDKGREMILEIMSKYNVSDEDRARLSLAMFEYHIYPAVFSEWVKVSSFMEDNYDRVVAGKLTPDEALVRLFTHEVILLKKSRHVNDKEKRVIQAMHESNFSISSISRILERSKETISRMVHDQNVMSDSV